MRKRHGWAGKVLVLVLVAALVGVLFPDRAYAPFRGMLTQGSPYTFEISNNVNNSDSCAATALKINRQGRIVDVVPLTVPLNQTGTITDIAASNIDRVILILNPPPPGPLGPPIVTVRTSQNNAVVSNDTYNADTEIVYDAVP